MLSKDVLQAAAQILPSLKTPIQLAGYSILVVVIVLQGIISVKSQSLDNKAIGMMMICAFGMLSFSKVDVVTKKHRSRTIIALLALLCAAICLLALTVADYAHSLHAEAALSPEDQQSLSTSPASSSTDVALASASSNSTSVSDVNNQTDTRPSLIEISRIVKALRFIEVHFNISGPTTMLRVMTPSNEDFQWLMTGLEPTKEHIKRDWNISEQSNIPYINAMQGSLRQLTDVARLLDGSGIYQHSFVNSLSDVDVGMFFTNAIKRITYSQSSHIVSIYQAGHQWMLFCELRGPTDNEPVYMLYDNVLFDESAYTIIKPPKR